MKYGVFTSETLEIEITEGYEMPAANESNIAECLKKWRMGTEINLSEEGMNFSMVTNKIEYVFMMLEQDCNIYCGASVNIPYEEEIVLGGCGGEEYIYYRNGNKDEYFKCV